MKEKKDISTLLQEAVDAMVEHGGTPHVIICNKKTWEKIALRFRGLTEEKFMLMPLQIWLVYEGGDLPILKFKYSPDDRIDVLNRDTYERLMKETKGKYSFSPHFKTTAQGYFETVTYERRGLYFDFGKNTIIKRIE
jgi:hypothetical protein